MEGRKKKWVTFNFHNPLIRKITDSFHNTNLKVAFKTPNTIFKMLQEETRTEQYNNNGIYGIKCNTCGKWYIGQTA
jgi:hypothetical protein